MHLRKSYRNFLPELNASWKELQNDDDDLSVIHVYPDGRKDILPKIGEILGRSDFETIRLQAAEAHN